MTVAELISILQKHDQSATVVVSMCPSEDSGDRDVVEIERSDISAVHLRALDAEEYRKCYATVLEDGVAGVCLV